MAAIFGWLEDVEDGYADPEVLPPHLQRFAPFLNHLAQHMEELETMLAASAEEGKPQLRLLDNREG